MEYQVKDGRKWHYTKVANTAMDDESLDIYDAFTYTALSYYADGNTGECFPSLNTLCKKARCSKGRLTKSLKVLEEKGYISREKRQNEKGNISTLYTVLNPRDTLVHQKDKPCSPHEQGVVHQKDKPCSPHEHRTRSIELDPYEQEPTNELKSGQLVDDDIIAIQKTYEQEYASPCPMNLVRKIEENIEHEGMELDVILEAIKLGRNGRNPLTYIPGILRNWREEGVRTKEHLEQLKNNNGGRGNEIDNMPDMFTPVGGRDP